MSIPNNDEVVPTVIRVIPPLVYLAGFVVGLLLEYLWSAIDLPQVWRLILSLPLLLGSIALIIFTLKEFETKATPFDVRKTATSLIIGGPFQFTRNPGYLALTLLYVSISVLISSIWVLVLTVPILFIIDLYVIQKEEANLLDSFGEKYSDYQSKVRRWI